MDPDRKRLLWIVGTPLVVLAALVLVPRAQERLAPRPHAAWVAIEPEGSGLARVGRVELAAGQPFVLRAVLEAEATGGGTIYYTEATRLEIAGTEIPGERLRRWEDRRPARVRWFTVEGHTPYLEVADVRDLEALRFEELFRPDWPATWTVPGTVAPRHAAARAERPDLIPDFGTQRYHVRIELYERAEALAPEARFRSWGSEELGARWRDFPTVVATFPGGAATAARAFGLTQIEPTGEPDGDLAARLSELAERDLAFSRIPLLAAGVRAAGGDPGALSWRPIDVGAAVLAWGREAGAGDLLQSGGRTVVVARDAGVAGRLDPGDLCLDFARGARLLPLSRIFTGADGLRLAWAPVAARAPVGRPAPGDTE